jgi:hypothetical protein
MKFHRVLIMLVAGTLALGIGKLAAAGGVVATVANATLTGKQEVPPQTVKVADASGQFFATFTKIKNGYRMNWKLTFKNMSGPVKFAHIHQGKVGQHGAALFFLCGPCASGAHGSAYASPFELNSMRDGETYVNVRTAKNPAGEIRGQIRVR